MLSLILMTVLSTASAQDEFADVAAPEPEGCWGDAASPFPAQDATNVPVDTSPRFFLDGRCAGAVDIVMVDVDDTVIDVVLDEQEHEWSTTIIVDPVAELSPSTAYTMTITTEFGQPSELRFTTGEAVSEPRPDLEVLGVMADGWCSGQEQADFGLSIEVGSDQEGLVGYAGASSTSAFGWSPILVQNGRANLWVNTTAQLGATEACASIARLEDDGSLGEWQEVCAPTPDLGDCRERRQFLGCGGGGRPVRGGDPVPLAAFLFLPLVGLLGRRRRR